MSYRATEIKEEIFPARDINATELSDTYSQQSINGRIIEVVVSTNGTGSIFLFVSGTNEPILNGPGGWSGANAVVAYPKVEVTDNVLTALSQGSGNNIWTERVSNAPLFYAGSGWISGTNNDLNYIKVFYI